MKRTMKKLFGLLSVVLLAVICFTQPVDAAKKEKRAKYVFYFIGDGMGINQVNGTEMYLAERAGKIGVEPLNFTTFPVRNFVTTYSAYNSVTCSAAAGTALATGEKTKNGTIAMDKEHKAPVYSIATKAKELGMKVSLIPKDNPSYEPNADAEEAAATSPTLDVFDVLLAGVEADD